MSSAAPLYVRAALGAVRPRGSTVPDIVSTRADVAVDAAHLARYARVCGFALGDVLPPTYPHVLGFGQQLALLTDRAFPIAAIGAVHVRNTITVHRAVRIGERLVVRVHAERFVPHRRGATVDLVTAVSVGDERVWDGCSTYLARGATAPGPAGSDAPAPPGVDGGPAAARWRVDAATGRRYARVSGDVNPIHLHALPARAFGFPRAIAHGMWTAARALAALQGRLPDALTYDVGFGKALPLPSTVELRTARTADGWDLDVRGARSAVVHLAARVSGRR